MYLFIGSGVYQPTDTTDKYYYRLFSDAVYTNSKIKIKKTKIPI